MPRSAPVDGFALHYERTGAGPDAPAVLLLHGWPGMGADQAEVAARLAGDCDVVVPDLRGFGASDRPTVVERDAYGAKAQAASLLGLLDELGIEQAVLSGYDIGSRIAQALARQAPGRVRALVLSPPLPGAGTRVQEPAQSAEYWYQHLHQLSLIEDALDGRPEVAGAYVQYFWDHWSAGSFTPPAEHLRAVREAYGRPGALAASVGWYRAGSATVLAAAAERTPDPARRTTIPTTVLWPTEDELFPPAWADRLDDWFADVELRVLDGIGHFVPREAPDAVAAAIRARL